MEKLIEKFGDDIPAMVSDKLNILQYTENKLRREYWTYTHLGQSIDRQLYEKYTNGLILDGRAEDEESEEQEVPTMSIAYASRIEQLQKEMQ